MNVSRLQHALAKAMTAARNADDFASQMKLQGMELMGGGPEDFAALIKRDTAVGRGAGA